MTSKRLSCYDAVMFDLDGTLWDCFEIVKTVWEKELGIVYDKSFMGKTVEEVSEIVSIPVETLMTCQNKELDYIKSMNPIIFTGAINSIKELSKRAPVFIVSNCQEGYIDVFLQKSGIAEYITDFRYFKKSKANNIRELMSIYNLSNPIYVGDTDGDKKAALLAGVKFIYAAYGFGDTDWADFVSKPEDIAVILEGCI